MDDAFTVWLAMLVKAGHDRHWVRHNIPALRTRFARDQTVFDPLPEPEPEPSDRYEGLM